MKKLLIPAIFISILLITLSSLREDEGKYYYAFDRKVKLIPLQAKLLFPLNLLFNQKLRMKPPNGNSKFTIMPKC